MRWVVFVYKKDKEKIKKQKAQKERSQKWNRKTKAKEGKE